MCDGITAHHQRSSIYLLVVQMPNKRPKNETFPKHIMGESCGGTLHEDGSIEVAPIYREQFAALSARKEGVDAVLAAVSKHCAAISTQIATEQNALWKRIAENYRIDQNELQMHYNSSTNRLVTTPNQSKPKDPVPSAGG